MSRLMVITEVDNSICSSADLAKIRRLEALMARAWPAGKEVYNGVWVCRSTPDSQLDRINSVTPLDPNDDASISDRVKRLSFENDIFMRPLRLTPLAPLAVTDYLRENGWANYKEVAVMNIEPRLRASDPAISLIEIEVEDYIKSRERNYFSDDQYNKVSFACFQRIKGKPSFFRFYHKGEVIGDAVIVNDFGQIGVVNFSIDPHWLKCGLATIAFRNLLNSLSNKVDRPAVPFLWLEVETQDNVSVRFYEDAGFKTVYRYQYWRPST